MPTLDLGHGRTVYYEEHGQGEPLLCVMGLAADTLSWALQLPAFSERHRTIIFDNRDVGRSSQAGGEYEISDMAGDALALGDALELGTFHLLGVSMGGAIAQEMALAAPERVRTLTLAVTFARAGAWARLNAELWCERIGAMSRERRIDELLLLNLSAEFFEQPEAVERARALVRANPHPQEPEAFCRQLRAGSRHDALDRLPSLRMPVHVIGGERDILVPVWKSQELAEAIPGARLTVLERAPHGLTMERASEFNRVALEFIAEHEPARAPQL